MDNVEPRFFRVLEKVSSTIDRNEERCEETDRKDQHEMEWKQVALVLGNVITSKYDQLVSTQLDISNWRASSKLDFSVLWKYPPSSNPIFPGKLLSLCQ